MWENPLNSCKVSKNIDEDCCVFFGDLYLDFLFWRFGGDHHLDFFVWVGVLIGEMREMWATA